MIEMDRVKTDRAETEWKLYPKGGTGPLVSQGEFVTVTASGMVSFSGAVTHAIPAGCPWMRIEWSQEGHSLRLTPVEHEGPACLRIQRPKSKGVQARLGAAAGLRIWGLVPDKSVSHPARWVDKAIVVDLSRPFDPNLVQAAPSEREVYGVRSDPCVLSAREVKEINKAVPGTTPIGVDPRPSAVPTSPAMVPQAATSSTASSSPVAVSLSFPDPDLIDILMVTQLAKCSEPTLYVRMKSKGFPRPALRVGKKCFWSRRAVAQWIVTYGGRKKSRASKSTPTKPAPCCGNCADGKRIGQRTMCRSESRGNPNRNHSVVPAHYCDWHSEPSRYQPVRMDEED